MPIKTKELKIKKELIKLSVKYAIQMALTARIILMAQVEVDAGEARHL